MVATDEEAVAERDRLLRVERRALVRLAVLDGVGPQMPPPVDLVAPPSVQL